MFAHAIDCCNCPGKQCRSCGQVKCHGAFNRDKKSKCGLQGRCRACQRVYRKAYNAAHREEKNERRRKWRQENAERDREYNEAYYRANIERHREYTRLYRQNNPESVRKSNRLSYERHCDMYKECYKANRDKYRERIRAYRRHNLEHYAIYAANRYARKKNVGGSIAPQRWEELKQHYNYTCLRCGKREPDITLTMDHVIPITKNGINSIENIQPLCGVCNSSKGTRIIDYRTQFRRESL